MSSEGQNEQFKFCEMAQNDKFNDLAEKFRTYRLNAESTVIKLSEAHNVIEQLKAEINISKDVKTDLRNQITSSQDRLIHVHKIITKILTVSERICQSEKTSLEIERKVNEIEDVIQKVKEESQNLFKLTSNELDLLKKYQDVKLELNTKEIDNNLLKIENQTLFKQKQEIEKESERKYKILENELEELKRENTKIQSQFDQTIRIYKKQIEDHELTISEYERERKSLLEEFAMPKQSEESSDIAWADSTVMLIPDDRSPKKSKIKSSIDFDYNADKTLSNSAIFQDNRFSTKPKPVIFKPKKGNKEKPQLEFLTCSQKSGTPPPKRRLFSMNCNHYAN